MNFNICCSHNSWVFQLLRKAFRASGEGKLLLHHYPHDLCIIKNYYLWIQCVLIHQNPRLTNSIHSGTVQIIPSGPQITFLKIIEFLKILLNITYPIWCMMIHQKNKQIWLTPNDILMCWNNPIGYIFLHFGNPKNNIDQFDAKQFIKI